MAKCWTNSGKQWDQQWQEVGLTVANSETNNGNQWD